jgi:hypothetical protein
MSTPSIADAKSLAGKIDGAGLTDEERSILAAIAGRAATPVEREVEGFTVGFLPEIDDEVLVVFSAIFDTKPGHGIVGDRYGTGG